MRIRIPSFLTNELSPNLDGVNLLETFLISAVSSLLIVRTYLSLAGYPQIGGGGFHIAHMLWGGLLMMVAIMMLLTFLSSNVKNFAAILGGIGFGTFIDELGKFITSDNNYFYQPTIALIYVLFVLIFLIIRFLSSVTTYSSNTYTINAVEALKEVIRSDLDDDEKHKALEYLKKSQANGHVVTLLTNIIKEASVSPKKVPVTARYSQMAIDYYKRIIGYKVVSRTVLGFFIFASVVNVALAAYSVFFLQTSIANTGFLISTILSAMIVILGMYYFAHKDLLRAYYFFQRATLVSIFLSQFFLFLSDQLSAITWLLVYLTVYMILKYETEHELKNLPQGVTTS